MTNGEKWREHRRFALHALRDLGIGRVNIEPRITMELHWLYDEIQKQQISTNGRVDWRRLVTTAIGNIINATVYGSRFDVNVIKIYESYKFITDDTIFEYAIACVL